MKPVRVQLSRRKGWRLPENTVKVSRPSKWGNPFVIGRDGDRARCVELYRRVIAGSICVSCRAAIEQQRALRGQVETHLGELRGKNLACWCRLDGGPCHADVLLEAANS